jgi:hypothetical protein
MLVRLLSLILISILFGCTAATPNVSSIGGSLFLSSKSPSPFEQESNSGAVVFSGTCTALSKSFEFRLDGVTAWINVPLTPPSPGPSEWTPAVPIYDLDCSNGTFNFYIFISNILAVASTHYGSLASDYEPHLLEIRTLNSSYEVNPGTINFERPIPSAYRLSSHESPQWWMGTLEREQPVIFEVSLSSSNGREVKPYPSALLLDLTSELASGSSAGLGTFYQENCSSTLDTISRTFTTSDRRKKFCYIPNNVDSGARIRLVVSGNGLVSQSHEFNVLALNSVYLQLDAHNDSFFQRIPYKLVKGAQYKLKTSLSTFHRPSVNRSVQSFTGDIIVSAGTGDVNFARSGIESPCPATATNSLTCATLQNGTYFAMTVAAGSSLSNLNLNLSAVANSSCANCLIEYPDLSSSVPIQSYMSQNLGFQLASGPLTYSRPVIEFPDNSLRQGECRELFISLGNSNGHTLPAPALSPTLRIQGPLGLNLYKDLECSTSALGFYGGTIQKMVLRPDGKILAAGNVTGYRSETRNRLAVINPDGTLERTFVGPETYFNGNITALLPLPDGRTLVAGDASNLSNDVSSKDYLVLLRADGRVESGFAFTTNGPVNSLLYDPTSNLIFLGGDFTQLIQASTPHPRNGRLAALNYNPSSGLISLNTWGQSLSLNSTVFSLLAHAGKLYVGGGFSSINGSTAVNSLVRFDVTTGALEAWPAGFIGPNNVLTLAYDPNQDRILTGGIFTSVNLNPRSRIAAFDVSTGNLTSLNPGTGTGDVYNLKVSGSELYVSGTFNSIGGIARNGLARFNLATDALTTWNPLSNGAGYHPLVISHEAAYIAGTFSNLGGISVNTFGRVDLINANGMVEFGPSSPLNQTALSFSPYDLIKKIYMRAETGLTGPVGITVNDGNQTVTFILEVRGP